jgi:hypothetical protein
MNTNHAYTFLTEVYLPSRAFKFSNTNHISLLDTFCYKYACFLMHYLFYA